MWGIKAEGRWYLEFQASLLECLWEGKGISEAGTTWSDFQHFRILRELKLRDPRFPNVSYGVLIHKVITGSPAYLAGVRPGDIVLEINGRVVKTAEDVYRAVHRENSLTVVVRRGSEELMINIVPEVPE
ncbi:hypothetical protein chiPu_0026063 [Chiloscyllium punctatum]|uniref:PDZ domain-containing protein n=1 Tax=Chiloscyllium punctatum TaxID=137246 RepID=A0A401THJ7_CHIPU|nr:hypothetical protein [Chiloscyllium punctatum]